MAFSLAVVSLLLAALLVLFGSKCTSAFSAKSSSSHKVVVVGASTGVGKLVFEKLTKKKGTKVVGLVERNKELQQFRKTIPNLSTQQHHLQVCDPSNSKHSISGVFAGVDQVIICSTAVPKTKLIYKVKKALRTLFFRPIRKPLPSEQYYPKGRRPYEIDYLGTKRIIDECVKANVQQVVFLSSMGGYLGSKKNEIGRLSSSDDIHNGNYFYWKKAAERYLIKRCAFTILHAGKLTNEDGGKREIIWDVDDVLLRSDYKSISEADAAETIVQSLLWREALGRSIDIANGPVKLKMQQDWLKFWSRPGNCMFPSND